MEKLATGLEIVLTRKTPTPEAEDPDPATSVARKDTWLRTVREETRKMDTSARRTTKGSDPLRMEEAAVASAKVMVGETRLPQGRKSNSRPSQMDGGRDPSR